MDTIEKYYKYDNMLHKHIIEALPLISADAINYIPYIIRLDENNVIPDIISERIFQFRYKIFDNKEDCIIYAMGFLDGLKEDCFINKGWCGQKQTSYDNCMMTSIANYFGLDIKQVPQIELLFESQPDSFWYNTLKLYINSLGYDINKTHKEDIAIKRSIDNMYFTIGSTNRSSGYLHQVISKNGEFIFDPHEDNSFLKEKLYYEFITKSETSNNIADFNFKKSNDATFNREIMMKHYDEFRKIYKSNVETDLLIEFLINSTII